LAFSSTWTYRGLCTQVTKWRASVVINKSKASLVVRRPGLDFLLESYPKCYKNWYSLKITTFLLNV